MCLCIVSKYPYIKSFSFILKRLHRKMYSCLPYPFESYISYFTSCIPAVPHGFYKLCFEVLDSTLNIEPPQINRLPLCDIAFGPLVRFLTPEGLLDIVNHLLLERSVLLVSGNIKILHPVMEAVLMLMFPFKYQLIYVPVLPYKQVDLLQTECPFFIGMHDSLFSRMKRNINSDVLVVNLNSRKKMHVENRWIEADTYNMKVRSKLVEFPEQDKENLLTKISGHFNKLKTAELSHKTPPDVDRDSAIAKIREAFVRFFAGVLTNIHNSLHVVRGEYRVRGLEKVNEKCREFVKAFADTEMFGQWLRARGHPKSVTEAHNILLFEEYIAAEQNVRSSRSRGKKVHLLAN